MRSTRRLFWLLLLGVVLLGGAAWFRAHTLETRRRAQATAREVGVREMEARERMLRAAVDAAPKDAAARRALIDFYRQTDQTDPMVEQLEALVRLEPENEAARLLLAKTRLALAQREQAETDYREAVERWPQNAEAWQGLAAVLFHQERYLEAIQAAQQAVRLAPDDPHNTYLLATATVEHVLQFPDNGGYDEPLYQAKEELEKLVKQWPNRGDVHYRLGRASVALREFNAAQTYLRRAIELSPQRLDVRLELTRALIRLGDRPAARIVVEEGLAQFPNSGTLHDLLGQLLQVSGEPGADQKAREHFQKAVELQPETPSFWENLGTSHMRHNALAEARKAFETALRINPYRIFAHQQLAAVYTRQGDTQKAKEVSQKATQLHHNKQQIQNLQSQSMENPNDVRIRLELAERYRKIGLLTPARNEYLLVLRLDAGNERARKGLAALSTQPPEATAPGASG